MPAVKDLSQARSPVQNRSNAQNVSQGAISLPAVATLPAETFEANREQQQIQLKKSAADPGSPENNASPPPGTGKPVQKQENKTGLPDQVKSGIEILSGQDISDVNVHYNSAQPAQLNAFAFAQGTQIHVAPGQEQHVAHEAWHVVQQKQGRVRPTMQMKQGIAINDDESLEKEADIMGARAVQGKFVQSKNTENLLNVPSSSPAQFKPVQRKVSTGNPPVYSDMVEGDIAKLNQPGPVNAVMRGWIADQEPRIFPDQMKVIKAASEVVYKARFDGTLKGLAAVMNSGDISGIGLLSDDALWDILKGPFEANWFKAKSCLAMGRWPSGISPAPSHEESLSLMEALVRMRKNKWDAFYAKFLPKAKTALNDNTLEIPPPDGSSSVTSDIDLSVKGAQSEAALEYFNTNFRAEFGVAFEPGSVFDINLYSLDWMHGGTETITGEAGNRTSTIVPAKENNLQGVDLAALEDRSNTQEMWSYVKIMRNLSPVEISAYKTQVLNTFTKGTPKYIAMSKKLDDAEQNTIAFQNKVAMKAEEMSEQFNANMRKNGLRTARSSFTFGATSHDKEEHYRAEALKTSASNAIYQELVKEVKALRVRIKIVKDGAADSEGKSIENLATLLANKISEALTYANEVYASEGGVLHTVYGKQKANKKKAEYAASKDNKDIKTVNTVLSKKQYIQSVNENVGDSIHSLNHNSHMPKYAVFRAGKYLDRLCEATDLLDETAARTFANYAELKNIGTVAAKEKDGELGRDPLAVNTHELFGTYNAQKVGELKTKIIAFGAQATSHFNTVE